VLTGMTAVELAMFLVLLLRVVRVLRLVLSVVLVQFAEMRMKLGYFGNCKER